MANSEGQKTMVITQCPESLRDLFIACCEIENVDRAEGFKIMLRPWVQHVLDSLGIDPCRNVDQLALVQDKLNELFPQPVERAGGYVG